MGFLELFPLAVPGMQPSPAVAEISAQPRGSGEQQQGWELSGPSC